MKLKVTKQKLVQPVEGVRSILVPDTLVGDSIGIASGENILLVKFSDLVDFLNQQEVAEARESSNCPA